VHCHQRPTVEVTLEVPRNHKEGCWAWVPCTRTRPEQDFVYTRWGACRVMRILGQRIAAAQDSQGYPRIRLRMRGLCSDLTIATHEWWWNEVEGRYEPQGDPVITMTPMRMWSDDAVRAWAVLQGKTRGGYCGSCPERPSAGRS
jgi:hypothetical protein